MNPTLLTASLVLLLLVPLVVVLLFRSSLLLLMVLLVGLSLYLVRRYYLTYLDEPIERDPPE